MTPLQRVLAGLSRAGDPSSVMARASAEAEDLDEVPAGLARQRRSAERPTTTSAERSRAASETREGVPEQLVGLLDGWPC
jgi:hypothetical protein